MKEIPQKPYKNSSKAEYKFFDVLSRSFDDSFIFFHSLNIAKHINQRFGESDFVILCKYGLFVLEVKGGLVSCEDGDWYSVDKDGIKNKIKNPIKQAQYNMYSLVNELKAKLKHIKFYYGYGIVLPDTSKKFQSIECDERIVFHMGDLRNFENSFKKFVAFWRNQHMKISKCDLRLSSDEINEIKNFLRPNFYLIRNLNYFIDDGNFKLEKATNSQCEFLERLSKNKRILCSGGAGTGKTFLAAHLCKKFKDSNKNIGFICKSSWLKNYLENFIGYSKNIIFSTIDGVETNLKRANIDIFDALIIDEGQDLFNIKNLETINLIVKDGLKDGEIYLFHDINNQSNLFDKIEPNALEMLDSCNWTHITLDINCRNTLQILEKINSDLKLDVGVKGFGDGQDVVEIELKNSAKNIEKLIDEIIKNDVNLGNITILSPFKFENSIINQLSSNYKNMIKKLDDFLVRKLPLNEISFAQIKDFKGLENDVVILVDLDRADNSLNLSNHYVGMSRAKIALYIVWN